MKLKRKITNYYLPNCQWSPPVIAESGNTHQLGRLKPQVEMQEEIKGMGNLYVFKTVKNMVEISQDVELRLRSLIKIANQDNIVSLNHYSFKGNASEVYIVTSYFPKSINLHQFMREKYQSINKLPSKISAIFRNIALALQKASQEYQVAHLRLCPAAILIKIGEEVNDKTIGISRVCDFGIGLQKISSKKQKRCCYMHPDILNNTNNPYKMSVQQCFKYDIWSFGAMLFQILYNEPPFGKLINSKDTISRKKCIQWLKDKQIKKETLFGLLLYRCFGISQPFENWQQFIDELQKNFSFSKVQKMPIQQIFVKHIRLMYLFSQVYIKTQERIKDDQDNKKENSNWTNMGRMQKLAELLIMYGSMFHEIQFKTYFYNRCYVLGPKAIYVFDKITQFYRQQLSFLKQSSIIMKKIHSNQPESIDDLFDDHIDKLAISCKLLLNDKQIEKDQALKTVCKFWDEFFSNRKKAKDQLSSNIDMDRQTFLIRLYQSQIFYKMAVEKFSFDEHYFLQSIYI